jgi:hypothetical protein
MSDTPSAASRLATLPRAADGSMAGPGLTPYAPYRMGPQRQPAQPGAQPVSRATATMTAPRFVTPELGTPVAGTMPMEPDVQGISVNPLARTNTAQVIMQGGDEARRLAAEGRFGAAIGESARAALATIPALGSDLFVRPGSPLLAGTLDAGRQFLGLNDPRSTADETSASKNPASDQGVVKQAATPAQASTGMGPNATARLATPTQVRPGVFRTERPGQSVEFGDAASLNDTGFQNRGAITPQNMRAADALAARSTAEARAGINRAQFNAEVAQAQAINAARVGQRTGGIGDYIRSGMERRALANENTASAIDDRASQARSRSAADVLAQRRQNESEANSAVTRRSGEVELQGAEQMQALRDRVLNAETPQERNEAAAALMALSGREQQNRYTVIPGGQEYDSKANAVLTRRSLVLDNASGRLVDLGGRLPQTSPFPDGQLLNGKDGKVYVVKNGEPVLVGSEDESAVGTEPPPDAIAFLRDKGKDDPTVIAFFDARYGKGAAARYLPTERPSAWSSIFAWE